MRLGFSIKFSFMVVFLLGVPASYGEESEYRSIAELKDKGFVKCSGAQSIVTKWVFDKDDFAYYDVWSTTNPDMHTGSTIGTKKYPDTAVIAAISSTPTLNGECDTSFVQIMVSAESCPKLRDTLFKDWKFANDLGGTPVYQDPTSPNVSIVLTPIETSCLIVKHGALFFAAETKSGK